MIKLNNLPIRMTNHAANSFTIIEKVIDLLYTLKIEFE